MSKILTEALVLVVEEKQCTRCGEVTRAPAGLFIRCRGRRDKVVYKRIDEVPVRSFLTCEKKVVWAQVSACEACFPVSHEGQLPLFPDTFGRRFVEMTAGPFPEDVDLPAAKANGGRKPEKGVEMYQLSDF